MYLAIINAFLFALCFSGFFIAARVYERIAIDTDIIVGVAFISLGLWYVLHYFISSHINHCKNNSKEKKVSLKTFVLVGLVMSFEAMIITMGITFIFLPYSTFIIPITVAIAHFGYSALSFYLARTKYVKNLPTYLSHIISGLSLIIYGLLALFIEFEI